MKKNDIVEYRATMHTKTKYTGIIKSTCNERIWIFPTHIDGKKVKENQETLTCINKNLITKPGK